MENFRNFTRILAIDFTIERGPAFALFDCKARHFEIIQAYHLNLVVRDLYDLMETTPGGIMVMLLENPNGVDRGEVEHIAGICETLGVRCTKGHPKHYENEKVWATIGEKLPHKQPVNAQALPAAMAVMEYVNNGYRPG